MLSFEKFGKLVSRITIPLAIVFCIIMIPAFYLSNQNSYYYGSSHIFAAGTQYGDDTAFIEDTFGIKDTYDLMDTITADMFKVNLVAIGAVFLVLVLTMIIVGFLLGIISTHGLLSQLRYLLGKGTICSLICVLFVLPGMLYLTDRKKTSARDEPAEDDICNS